MGARGRGISKHIGVDRIMWSSDYPHTDSTWPHSQKTIAEHFACVPDGERRLMVCDTAAKLYGFVCARGGRIRPAKEISFGVRADHPSVVDDGGRQYPYQGGGDKFRMEGATMVYAGQALNFNRPPDPSARVLTLTLADYGEMVRGPWAFQVRLR